MVSTQLELNRREHLQIQDRDIRLFRLILEQKFLTRPQIVEHIYERHQSAAAARLQKLVRARYLRAKRVFVSEPQSYLLGAVGVEALKAAGYAVGVVQGFPVTYGVNLPKPQPEIEVSNYEHDKKVTNIRFLWEGTGLARDWQSEKFLKMGRRRDRKVPDGFFTVAERGIAIEVELKAKSSDRYRKIIDAYLYDSRVYCVFYICKEAKILRKICRLVQKMATMTTVPQKPFFFTTYDELARNQGEALMMSQRHSEFRLEILLSTFKESAYKQEGGDSENIF